MSGNRNDLPVTYQVISLAKHDPEMLSVASSRAFAEARLKKGQEMERITRLAAWRQIQALNSVISNLTSGTATLATYNVNQFLPMPIRTVFQPISLRTLPAPSRSTIKQHSDSLTYYTEHMCPASGLKLVIH